MERRNTERRNDGTRNSGTGFFFCFFFFLFFFFKQKNNNKQTVNISHKIKGMHIFFILRGRSRAKLSSLFRVRISRSVTALRTCLGQPFFFFVYCRMRFLILGRSVGKEKKKETKKKIGKGVWN